jgi:hypothetical protein
MFRLPVIAVQHRLHDLDLFARLGMENGAGDMHGAGGVRTAA